MYDTIKLNKDFYSISGKSFTQVLEELDPTDGYKGTALENLDAFERQLKRFDIKVSGKNSDKVEKFFQNGEASVLFPEYIRRTIKQGMEDASIFGDIAASVAYIDSLDYRAFNTVVSSTALTVDQSESIGINEVTLSTPVKQMTKYARGLNFSYEAMRKQRLDSVGVMLRHLGAQLARKMNVDVVNGLKTGLTAATITGTSLTYNDLAGFWASMTDCNMSAMIVSPAVLAKILSISEMKNFSYDYVSANTVTTPFGITLVKCPGLSDDIAVGLDKSCALEVVFGSDLLIESDREIITQSSNITASVLLGFTKLIANSVMLIKTSN
ncbi:MAG: hypothetical protein ACI4RC_02530 [Oscillospiraceae bacterium]